MRIDRRTIENRTRTYREAIEKRSRTERRTMREIYHRNCWADCYFAGS